MFRFRPSYLLLALLTIGGGCSKPAQEGGEAAAPVQAAEAAAEAGEEAAAPAADSEESADGERWEAEYGIRLVEAGAEPRRELRFAFDQDQTRLVTTEIRITQTVETDGQPQPEVPSAPIRSVMRVSPHGQSGEVADYNFELVGIEIVDTEDVPPTLLSFLEASLSEIPAIRGTITINNRGEVIHVRQTGETAGQPMANEVQNELLRDLIGIALPEEAVGVGASWISGIIFDAKGVDVMQETTYTLDAIEGDELSISWSVRQLVVEEQQEVPDLPPGSPKVTINKLEGGGAGSATLRLDRIAIPQQQLINLEMLVEAETPEPGASRSMLTRQQARRVVTVADDEDSTE